VLDERVSDELFFGFLRPSVTPDLELQVTLFRSVAKGWTFALVVSCTVRVRLVDRRGVLVSIGFHGAASEAERAMAGTMGE